jgi:hypothetical protein
LYSAVSDVWPAKRDVSVILVMANETLEDLEIIIDQIDHLAPPHPHPGPLYTYLIEDNQDGSYRDFTSAFRQKGWLSLDKKNKSKFEKRRFGNFSFHFANFSSDFLLEDRLRFQNLHGLSAKRMPISIQSYLQSKL